MSEHRVRTTTSMIMIETAAICAAAMLSGAAALAYELCWSRALVVPLGNSADAAALVLAGFMLGIAAGARLGGGLAERVRAPLRAYAALELLLGAYAIVAPALLNALSRIPGSSGGAMVGPVPLGVLGRGAAALVLIAVPGLAMGATLPLLVRALTSRGASVVVRIGVAYGANTLGAAAGAIATGFWGFASIGIRGCSVAAAGASAGAAVVALAAAKLAGESWGIRASDRREDAERSPLADGAFAAALERRVRVAALVAVFASGLSMLASELLWSRVLTFVFGHDTYAFSSLLAFVLLGLAAGGLLHRALARRDQAKLLGVLLAIFAVALLASFAVASSLVARFGRDPFGIDASGRLATSLRLELFRELSLAPILVFLPSLVSGALYPTACSVYGAGARDAARRVGVIGLANGIGSAIGALGGGFGLVSLAGIQGGFVLVALVCAAASSAAFLAQARSLRGRAVTVAAAPLAVVAVAVAVVPREMPRRMLLASAGPRHQRLLHYDEARIGTVSVFENDVNGERQLWMNAVNEVTTRLVHDQSFKLLGHLGPLVHPSPRTAVMICLGAGVSAGAALAHPLERLDVVDLSSAVAGGARHFARENNGVLDDPRLALHIDDGRQFLLNAVDRYDLAIVDSTHPKSVDSWILYTKEFYELLHDRLSDGGVAVQWLPLHGMSEREFKIIVRTFLGAFPHMNLWANVGHETYGHVGYAKLVGVRGGPLAVDYARLAERLADPRVRADLAPYGMDAPEELLDAFVAGSDAIDAWTAGLPVQTDDHPIVPYTTFLSRGRRMEPASLSAVRSAALPRSIVTGAIDGEAWKALDGAYAAQGHVVAGRLDRARELRPDGKKIRLFAEQSRTTAGYYAALAARYADDADKLFEIGTQLGSLGLPSEARAVYDKALAVRPDDFRVRLNLALLLANAGERRRAIELLTELRRERPAAAIVHHNLGAVVLGAGDPGTAAAHFRAALAIDPDAAGTALALAHALVEDDRLDRAEAHLADVLARDPDAAEAYNLQGVVAQRRGDHAHAAARHRRAVQLEPHRAAFHFDLGVALQSAGSPREASAAYEAALAVEPTHTRALHRLGLVHAAERRFDAAADLQLRALDLDPSYAGAAHALGLALRGQGRSNEAAGAFCLAITLRPDLVLARRELADLGTKVEDCARPVAPADVERAERVE